MVIRAPDGANKCFNKYIAKKKFMALLITRNVFAHNLSFPLLVFLRASREGEALLLGTEIGHSKNGGALLRKTEVGRLKAASTEEERLKRACTVHSAHAQCTHSARTVHAQCERTPY